MVQTLQVAGRGRQQQEEGKRAGAIAEAVGGGSWQQASGAVTGGSWQRQPSAGGTCSGVSSGGARGGVWSGCNCRQHIGRAETGGSWQKQLPVHVGGGGGSRGGGSGGGGWSGGSWLLGAKGATAGGCWQEQILVGEGDSSGGCSNGTMGGDNRRRPGRRRTAGQGGSGRGVAWGKGCSQSSKGVARGGCSQCSEGSLGATQSHSLDGLGVVIEGLSVCASPIMGLCHGWREGTPRLWDYDPATVDCWQICSTYHCLQQFRQFELSVNIAGGKATTQLCHLVYKRAGGKVVASGGARVVATRVGSGGGVGGGNSSGASD